MLPHKNVCFLNGLSSFDNIKAIYHSILARYENTIKNRKLLRTPYLLIENVADFF
jgi:hypothetical protein